MVRSLMWTSFCNIDIETVIHKDSHQTFTGCVVVVRRIAMNWLQKWPVDKNPTTWFQHPLHFFDYQPGLTGMFKNGKAANSVQGFIGNWIETSWGNDQIRT